MITAGEKIFNAIEKCPICDNHKPFHFEMGRQRIMLISYSPHQTALYRPLYFIRIFREICLALFGDVPPSEKFIKEFYDPAGNIYWTHYRKCLIDIYKKGHASCEPLLIKEIETLDPEVIIIFGKETIDHLYNQGVHGNASLTVLNSDKHPYIKTKKDGTPRKVFFTDFPVKGTNGDFKEIRKALKPYIDWVKIEGDDVDSSNTNFMDLEYAALERLKENEPPAGVKISELEQEWMDKIILPNVRAYNLALQVFIYIESNIKSLLKTKLKIKEDLEKKWFSPFEHMVYRAISNKAGVDEQRRTLRSLMEHIDSLNTLRNIIVHSSGVVSEEEENAVRKIAKLKRLRGVYLYGGNSIFISNEGVEYILGICNNFRKIYTNNFID